MSEMTPPRRSRWRRVLYVAGIAMAVIVTYRVLAVYRIRRTCPPPHPDAAAVARAPQRPLVVMTYNIQGHAALIRSDHIEEIAKTIREIQPDIVGLQEVHRFTWQSRFSDQFAELQRRTGMHGVFGNSFSLLGGRFGNAVLTRGRIRASEVVPLPTVGEPRSLLRTKIDIAGGTIEFTSTHLAAWNRANETSRGEQLECTASHLGTSPASIVVGDLNANDEAPEMLKFRERMVPLCGEELGPTHKFMRLHIDHIYASRKIAIRSARVLHTGPSDHWPLVVELEP